MWLIMKWKEYRRVKKVKSIYPDVKYYIIDRETGDKVKTVWRDEK